MLFSRRNFLQSSSAATVLSLVPASLADATAQPAAAQTGVALPGVTTTITDFPAGFSPKELGAAVAQRFVPAPHLTDSGTFYAEVCAWVGALQFARVTADAAMQKALVTRYTALFPGFDPPAIAAVGQHVDQSVFGALPLELYLATGDDRFRTLGLRYADAQWARPDAAGLSHETRFWIDDMYMITMLQVQAFRATKNPQYLDRAAKEVAAYLDKLQQPNGLFFHAPEVPFFWGRGNGWFAVGMAELLRDLPAAHPLHERVMNGYRRMMAGLLAIQAPDGCWRELLDRSDAWPESSGSGMFTFAFVTGLRNGWLDAKTFAGPTHRAWLSLAGYVDQNGDVTSVCQGTEKRPSAEWYLNRKRRTGDLRGQAPLLWSATALLR